MKKNTLIIFFSILSFLYLNLLGCSLGIKNKNHNEANDSISKWLNDKSFNLSKKSEKELKLNKIYNAINNKQIDSLTTKQLSSLAYRYLKLKDSSKFKLINNDAFALAIKLKDTIALADIHWNFANFYNNNESYVEAYYNYKKAYDYFEKSNQSYFAGKMLYGMAHIKAHFEDFVESEALIIKAISKYKPINNTKSLYASYNYLALIQKYLGEYDKSLIYYKKSQKFLDKMKNKHTFKESSLNNVGIIYFEKGDYKKAIKKYTEALNNIELEKTNPKLYAKLLDNRAFSKLHIHDTTDVKHDLLKSLKIRNQINHKSGVIINKLHLAKYYMYNNYKDDALVCALNANKLAKEIKNYTDYLTSLKLLAKLNEAKSNIYLNEYIIVKDSLAKINRLTQNKFARIDFETNEYIYKTKRLSMQRIWILITSLSIILISTLLLFLRTQKAKNQKLLFETEQQKANEQIYLLTLKERIKLEEGKKIERNRISEELHDGILGRLFGIRIGLGLLDLTKNEEDIEAHQHFVRELKKVEKEIRRLSHELKKNINNDIADFNILIENFLIEKSKIGGFSYQLKMDKNIVWKKINEQVKMNLFRILQELFQNIIKHANAKNVNLDFSYSNGILNIIIKDDGVGYYINKKKKGIGILNIKSRITRLKGSYNIESKINEGTKIKLTIPI